MKQPNRNYVRTLQLLLAPKEREIAASTAPELGTPPLTAAIKELQQRHRGAMAILRYVQRKLAEAHLDIQDDSRIVWNYHYRGNQKYEHRQQQLQRTAQLNALRAKAMIDLLDIAPKQAQRYLRELERKLARI